MKTCLLGRFIVCGLCFFGSAGSTVLYVHPDSTLNSIQVALDSCSTGDTVLVGPGVYFENVVWPYVLGINLLSEYGPDTTIIDGGKDGGVIHMSLMPVDSTTSIRGFTIRYGDAWHGGGIYSVGGKPRITDNIIKDNISQWQSPKNIPLVENQRASGRSIAGPPPRGGGIYTEWSSAVIVNNVISGNISHEGGGVACFCDAANIAPLLMNNTITENMAHAGGGVYIDCPFTMTVVRDNMISNNTANFGGGLSCYYVINPLLRIVDNTITDNSADSAGGGIWCYVASRPIIDSNTVSGNTGDGIYIGYNSSPLVTGNNIIDNIGFALQNDDSDELVMAENNWWGDATGPYHPTTNPAGLGDTVSDYVDYEPWMTLPGIDEHVLQPNPLLMLHAAPNPFSDFTVIQYLMSSGIDSRQTVTSIKIYDSTGRMVWFFNPVSSIENQVSALFWHGTDSSGNRLPGGVYFAKLAAGDYSETVKLVLLR